jgi:hypothetical protein
LILNKDISVLIRKDNLYNALLPKIKLNNNLRAPIKSGDVLGTVSYKVEGITYTYDLVASQDIKPSRFFSNLLIIIVLYVIFRIYVNKKKLSKKNRRIKKGIKK